MGTASAAAGPWVKSLSPEKALYCNGSEFQPSCSYPALPGRPRSRRQQGLTSSNLPQRKLFDAAPLERASRVPPARVHLADPLWSPQGGGHDSDDESEPSPRGWRSIDDGLGLNPLAAQQVQWFRSTWPYIQGHRGSTFVIVLPGEVSRDAKVLDGLLQDVALLHGLGVKILLVCGSQSQIDDLLHQKGLQPRFVGAYRVTDKEALEAAMEASGRIRLKVEAKLSRGPSIPSIRRHGENERWHEMGVSVASGNFVAAKRRGIIGGVDYGSTGEVKRVDVSRIRERLNSGCVVVLNNLGYTAAGEVLNCNAYEVATAAATALGADKMLCMLDGSVFDDNGRLLRWMTLQEADALVRERAETSGAAENYVDLMKGPPCITLLSGPGYGKTLDLDERLYSTGRTNGRSLYGASVNGVGMNGAANGAGVNGGGVNGYHMNGAGVNGSGVNGDELCELIEDNGHGRRLMNGIGAGSFTQPGQIITDTNGNVYKTTPWKRGFPVKGGDRLEGGDGYLAELAAAVYACKGGVRRVHLVDATVGGSLLLELYTRDGIGTMISSDLYEGTRPATSRDLVWIQGLLKPLEDDGILVKRSDAQMAEDLPNFTVVERDGAVIACAALFPFPGERCGEVAAFAVAPECRGHGRGDNLLDYLEKKAVALGLDRLFLLTTRTADWFEQRGFAEGSLGDLPPQRRARVNTSRGSKVFVKELHDTGSPRSSYGTDARFSAHA